LKRARDRFLLLSERNPRRGCTNEISIMRIFTESNSLRYPLRGLDQHHRRQLWHWILYYGTFTINREMRSVHAQRFTLAINRDERTPTFFSPAITNARDKRLSLNKPQTRVLRGLTMTLRAL
jgi:hypothetical protein